MSDELSCVSLGASELIQKAFGPWLRGFRLETLQQKRQQCRERVEAEDAQARARKEAYRQHLELRSRAEEPNGFMS